MALKQQDQNHNQLKKIAQTIKIHPIHEAIMKQKSGLTNNQSSTTNLTSSLSPSSSSSSSSKCQVIPDIQNDSENSFDKGLKSIKGTNSLVVVRGLVGLLLGMDFTCNMDLFLLTCKVIARLVSACSSSIQLSKIMTTKQLQQLIRIAVWKDQQQPWAVHAITCLLQDVLEADKNYKHSNMDFTTTTENNSMEVIPTNDQEDFSPPGNSNSKFNF